MVLWEPDTMMRKNLLAAVYMSQIPRFWKFLAAHWSFLPPHKVFQGEGGGKGCLLVFPPQTITRAWHERGARDAVEAALCLGRKGPFKGPRTERSWAAVVVASATKPELFLRNTQQKMILFVLLPPPSSPASQRRSSHSSRSSHTQLSQQSLCNAGHDFTPALRDVKPGCHGPIIVFMGFTSALHESPHSVWRGGGTALMQAPLPQHY